MNQHRHQGARKVSILTHTSIELQIFLNVSPPAGGAPATTSTARLDTLPSSLRNVRACLLCSLVKTVDQFEADGCDNCEQVLMLKHDDQRVGEGVGMVAVMEGIVGVHVHVVCI